jgi:surfeit locus 1 family protein
MNPALVARWWRLVAIGLLVAAGTVSLGFWQLDRLSQRRAFNLTLAARQTAEPLLLDAPTLASLPTGAALRALEYRPVVVRGRFDYAGEHALSNQVSHNQLGLHLVTPLVIAGAPAGATVLVNRGWIPAADNSPSTWARYREPGAR